MINLELFIQGIVQGSIYGLIALGLTLVYGLLRIIHVAHAGLFTLGAYLGVIVTNYTGSIVLATLCAIVVVGIVGMAIYRYVYRPLLDKPPFIALIASIALFISSEEIFRIIFGPYGLSYTDPPFQGSIEVFNGFFLKYSELTVIALSVVILTALGWFFAKTRAGISWRAIVIEPSIASAFGVKSEQVRYLNFFLGSALAAVAGVLVALLNNLVEPTMGSVASYKALAIIVLGGLGSIKGTLIVSLLLGVIEAYATIYWGSIMDRDAWAFAFLIVMLMIRPHGLFGGK